MKRRVLYSLVATLAIAVAASAWVQAAPQKSAPETIKARSVKLRGADPNVKQARVANTAGRPAPAPPSKGGAKTRGASMGVLHVDSRSGYYIDIYLDGRPAGTVGPHGDLYINCEAADWSFYAKAPGTSATWGPKNVSIPMGGTYHLRLDD